MVSATYPSQLRRTALAPAILATIALLIGSALITSDTFTVIRFIVSILALIVAVFAWQAGQWWWLLGLVPIVILWNPVIPVDLGLPELWLGLQFAAAGVFIAAGVLIKVTDKSP
ncbi:MAG: hypothetical protein H7226_09015 [Salinibacterium sp.]|nr:hypothetical protein [Salinibacterium sp.]